MKALSATLSVLALVAGCGDDPAASTDTGDTGAPPDSAADTVTDTATPADTAVDTNSDTGADTDAAVVTCLACQPESLAFGVVDVGAMKMLNLTCTERCGAALDVTAIRVEPADAALSVELGAGVATPLVLAAGESLRVAVVYAPTAAGSIASGTALVVDGPAGPIASAPISGSATGGETPACPKVVVTPAPGQYVDVGEVVALSMRVDPPGAAPMLTGYSWTLERPAGSAASLAPDTSSPEVSFTADVAGVYGVKLVAEGNNCTSSDALDVSSGGVPLPLHVYLWWKTSAGVTHPANGNAPDPGLHVARPEAGLYDLWGDASLEPWYDVPRDAFWGTYMAGRPDWGPAGAAGDPVLATPIDTGPNGQEDLHIDAPEAGLVYRVGVERYLNAATEAATPSPVVAHVDVFLGRRLVTTIVGPELLPADFWEVATVNPSTGEVVTLDTRHAGVDTCPMPTCN